MMYVMRDLANLDLPELATMETVVPTIVAILLREIACFRTITLRAVITMLVHFRTCV